MLFKERIEIENKSEVKYGHTEISPQKTMMEIREILQEYGCDRVLTDAQGNSRRIAFEYRGSRYMVQIPNVYLRGDFEPQIGPRVVKHYLETLLSWTEAGITTMERALMPARLVEVNGQSVPVAELLEQAPDGELGSAITRKVLIDEPESEAEGYLDVEVEDE